MFCCRSNKTFTLNHDLDSVLKVRKPHQFNRRPELPDDDDAHGGAVIQEQPVHQVPEIPPSTETEVPETSDENQIDASNDNGNDAEDSVESEGEDASETKRNVDRRGGFRAAYQVDTNITIPRHSKPDSVAAGIRRALLNNEFLRGIIPLDGLDRIIGAMEARDVPAKETIITQGAPGDTFYVSQYGRYRIVVNGKDVGTFKDQRVFGELAVLYKNPRGATIEAITDGRIWALDGRIFQALLIRHARNEEEQRLHFLQQVPLVKQASPEKLKQIARLMQQAFYAGNTAIIKQGEKGDRFFVVKAGRVKVTVNDVGVVAELSEGEFFGERALIEADVRQATCTAQPPGVTCLELARNDFITYLGDLKEFLAAETPSSAAQTEVKTTDEPVEPEFDAPALKDLSQLRIIGVGGFGRVVLCKDVNQGKVYALKMLNKVDNRSPEQREHAKNEKKIQIRCQSAFIVRLYSTYQTKKYLYFLMEACLGGDLFTLMQRQKGHCFDDTSAQFIAGCILEAIAYLHAKNYIYRDLKPENMLIDAQGYVKLADFGFARELKQNDTTYTFAGTPEYVAPEIIYNKGHNRAVDYWAFGIFIFELLVGKTPFKTNDPSYMKTYGLILKGIENIQMPSRISKSATSLVKKLCRLTPHERLGCQKRGADDIREHKWFSQFKWKDLQERRMKSKFVPVLTSPQDTKYFDDFGDDFPVPEDDNSVWEGF